MINEKISKLLADDVIPIRPTFKKCLGRNITYIRNGKVIGHSIAYPEIEGK